MGAVDGGGVEVRAPTDHRGPGTESVLIVASNRLLELGGSASSLDGIGWNPLLCTLVLVHEDVVEVISSSHIYHDFISDQSMLDSK